MFRSESTNVQANSSRRTSDESTPNPMIKAYSASSSSNVTPQPRQPSSANIMQRQSSNPFVGRNSRKSQKSKRTKKSQKSKRKKHEDSRTRSHRRNHSADSKNEHKRGCSCEKHQKVERESRKSKKRVKRAKKERKEKKEKKLKQIKFRRKLGQRAYSPRNPMPPVSVSPRGVAVERLDGVKSIDWTGH